MKVSSFQEKINLETQLHNALNLPKYVDRFHEAVGRSTAIMKNVYDEDTIAAATDICKAAYIEFITAAFEISVDTITTALVELKLLSVG